MRWVYKLLSRLRVSCIRGHCSLDTAELSVVRDLTRRHFASLMKVVKKLERLTKPKDHKSVDTLIRIMARDSNLAKTFAAFSGEEFKNGVAEITGLHSQAIKQVLSERGIQSTLDGKQFSELAEKFPDLISSLRRETVSRNVFCKLTLEIFEQLAPLLRSQLPARCSLLDTVCLQAIESEFLSGWAANEAAKVFLARFFANPLTYVYVERPSPPSYNSYSSAPRSMSRSEVRRR